MSAATARATAAAGGSPLAPGLPPLMPPLDLVTPPRHLRAALQYLLVVGGLGAAGVLLVLRYDRSAQATFALQESYHWQPVVCTIHSSTFLNNRMAGTSGGGGGGTSEFTYTVSYGVSLQNVTFGNRTTAGARTASAGLCPSLPTPFLAVLFSKQCLSSLKHRLFLAGSAELQVDAACLDFDTLATVFDRRCKLSTIRR